MNIDTGIIVQQQQSSDPTLSLHQLGPVSPSGYLSSDVGENMSATESETDQLISNTNTRRVQQDGHHVDGPVDRYHLVYCIMSLLGICTILPWNFFITAAPYFMYKLRNTSIHDAPAEYKTQLQANFESSLAVASQVPNAIMLMVNTIFFAHSVSLLLRLLMPLMCYILVFVATIVFIVVDTDQWQSTFYWITIGTVILVNGVSAIFQGGVFGISAVLPRRYTQAAMSGQGMGGVFASVCSIISLALSGHTSPQQSALAYFIMAQIVCLLAALSYPLLIRSHFFIYYVEHSKMGHELLHPDDVGADDDDKSDSNTNTPRPPFMILIRQMWVYIACIFLIFTVTLSIFPGLLSLIISTRAGHGNDTVFDNYYFVPVTCFLLFNFGDLCGRIIAAWLPLRVSVERYVLVPSVVLRVSFLPLYLYCNAHPRPHNLPVVFNHDLYPVLFTSLLSLTNGYLSTVVMMHGPRRVESRYGETAGSIMALSLVCGLAVGSAVSVALVKLL